MFFNFETIIPAKINIMPCPIEKRNNISNACGMLAESDAKAIIPASIGVEHGEPANAKTIPNKNG